MYRAEEHVLFGHVARTSPIASSLINGAWVLASFTGPHSYVSPTWSAGSPHRVPTWNYLAATATGVVQQLERKEALWVLAEFARIQEKLLGSRWSAELGGSRGDAVHTALLSFKLADVDTALVTKLSQRQPPAERSAIAAGLRGSTASPAGLVAEAMEANGE